MVELGRFSALQRAEIAEIRIWCGLSASISVVSVLFNEPKLLKCHSRPRQQQRCRVSVLFNEPKLLKSSLTHCGARNTHSFSALQRAEIAEIADILAFAQRTWNVSVLFNEPKLLKSRDGGKTTFVRWRFSALQRAEIAEMVSHRQYPIVALRFQCSSTSRNC